MKRRATGSPGRAERGAVWGAMSGPPTSKDVTFQREGRVAVVSGPLATRGATRIIGTRLHAGFGEARALSDTLRYAFERSQDVDEGAAAHREARTPRFIGR